MVMQDSGGGGGTVAPANVTIKDPEMVKNSDASTAISQAKGAVANATSTTDPVNSVLTPAPTTTTTTSTPTAADAVLALAAKPKLLKNTLGTGQAL